MRPINAHAALGTLCMYAAHNCQDWTALQIGLWVLCGTNYACIMAVIFGKEE